MIIIPTIVNNGIITKNHLIVNKFLKYIDLTARDESVYTPLELACKHYSDNYLEIIEVLLLSEKSD